MLSENGAPKKIASYDVLREIGRGGMAIVYEVSDSKGRSLALKVLNAARARTDRGLGRFLREGEAARRLDHPHIIKIFDVGQDGDFCYIAMDLIDGPTLEDLIFGLRRGRRRALAKFRPDLAHLPDPIVRQEAFQRSIMEALSGIASAVQMAHDAGLVHRDIKPSNILIGADGQLVLTDFGLVQDLGAETLTLSGDVLGTPLYMSPEQIAGDRQKIGPKSDVYALGATIHETLGLTSPYSATDIAVLARQISRHEPRDLAELNPSLPQAIHTIVRRAMAKRPRDRYASAQGIADDIQLYLAGKPIEGKPPTVMEKLRAEVRRRPAVAWSVAAAAGLSLVFLITFFVLSRGEDQRRNKEAQRSFKDGQGLLEDESWLAAWRVADEIEAQVKEHPLADDLRSRVEAHLEQAFAQNLKAGPAGLETAFQLLGVARQLTSSSLDDNGWRRQLGAELLRVATAEQGTLDEGSLNHIWLALNADASDLERSRWGDRFAVRCDSALAEFDFRSAYAIAKRAQRWGLRTEKFPPEDFEAWDNHAYRRLADVAKELASQPVSTVLRELDREAVAALPWPESRRMLQSRLKSASLEDALAILRVVAAARLPGFAPDLVAVGMRLPEFRRDLLSFWARTPDVEAQGPLVAWSRDFHKDRDVLQLAKALDVPGKAARQFLEEKVATADLDLLWVLAEVLGKLENKRVLETLSRRLVAMDSEERLSSLIPFIRFGGKPPWSWIEEALQVKNELARDLVRALDGSEGIVPASWSLAHEAASSQPLRRIARAALLAGETTRGEWGGRILFDQDEDMSFRIRAGLALRPSEIEALLAAIDPSEVSDPVTLAFSLSLDGSNYKKGSSLHVKRVAGLLKVYYESGDDLMRAWALQGLESLRVPEFAGVIAKDLATFEIDTTGSLLRDILGQSPKSLKLASVLGAFAKQGVELPLALNPDINSARCRFLSRMGRDENWDDRRARGNVARTLIECAARRDLDSAVRVEALQAIASYPGFLRVQEIKETAVFDGEGTMAAAAAMLFGNEGRPAVGLSFLVERSRPGFAPKIARAWLLAQMARPAECLDVLQHAFVSGFRRNALTPDFTQFAALRRLPGFFGLWRRLAESRPG